MQSTVEVVRPEPGCARGKIAISSPWLSVYVLFVFALGALLWMRFARKKGK